MVWKLKKKWLLTVSKFLSLGGHQASGSTTYAAASIKVLLCIRYDMEWESSFKILSVLRACMPFFGWVLRYTAVSQGAGGKYHYIKDFLRTPEHISNLRTMQYFPWWLGPQRLLVRFYTASKKHSPSRSDKFSSDPEQRSTPTYSLGPWDSEMVFLFGPNPYVTFPHVKPCQGIF